MSRWRGEGCLLPLVVCGGMSFEVTGGIGRVHIDMCNYVMMLMMKTEGRGAERVN